MVGAWHTSQIYMTLCFTKSVYEFYQQYISFEPNKNILKNKFYITNNNKYFTSLLIQKVFSNGLKKASLKHAHT